MYYFAHDFTSKCTSNVCTNLRKPNFVLSTGCKKYKFLQNTIHAFLTFSADKVRTL